MKLPGITAREVFTAWDPPNHFAFTLVEGPRILTAMTESITIQGDADECTITYAQGIEPATGFGRLVRRMAKRTEGRQRRALDRLAALVE